MPQRISRFARRFADRIREVAHIFSPARLFGAYRTFSRREKIVFAGAALLSLAGIIGFAAQWYWSATISVPARGGVFSEGVTSQPQYINPILPDTTEADQLLEQLIFAGLTKADGNGGYIPELAESIITQDNGSTYAVSLKNNLVWQDGQPITSDDVLFTLDLLKNKDLQNPQSYFWNTVRVEAISAKTIKFTLAQPTAYFNAYLSFKILPRHIWKSTPVNQLAISEFNLKPVGAGPYEFKKIAFTNNNQIAQYTLTRFDRYALPGPYFATVVLKFYPSSDDALVALKKKEVQSVANIPPDIFESGTGFARKALGQPTMTLLALNTRTDLLKESALRQAIAASIDTNAIADEFYRGFVSRRAFGDGIDGASSTPALTDPERARALLATLGWKDTDNDGIVDKKTSARAKTQTKLELALLTLDAPRMKDIATAIAGQLRATGFSVSVQALDVNEYTNRLSERSFDLALISFAPVTGTVPDLYPLLHSSQRASPGLNIAGSADAKTDSLLEQIRQADDPAIARELFKTLAATIERDAPIVFIAQPQQLWFVSKAIAVPTISFVTNAGERFAPIQTWYLYTKRIWKQ